MRKVIFTENGGIRLKEIVEPCATTKEQRKKRVAGIREKARKWADS